MATIEQLYGHLNTLTKQWFYDKSEIDTELSDVVRDADITDIIRTSQTNGLIKNDGTIDTTAYLSETEFATEIADYYDKDTVDGFLDDKADVSDLTTLDGEVIKKSQTAGLIKNDGTVDTNTYLTTGTASSTYVAKENGKGLFSGSYLDLTNIPESFVPSTHTHSISDVTDFSASASDILDSNAHTNLGTSANATQSAINTAIDTKIGSLLAVELIEVVNQLPTADDDTMNALYLVAEDTAETNDAYEIYVTVETATDTYAWEKVDTARIDLSGYALVDHVHGNISNDGKIGSTANQFVYTGTGGLVSAKATVGNLTTDGAIGTDTGKVVVTTTNGVLTTSDWVTEVDNVIQALNTYGNSLNSGSGN